MEKKYLMFLPKVKLFKINQLDQEELIKVYSKEICLVPYILPFFYHFPDQNIQEIISELLKEQAAKG